MKPTDLLFDPMTISAKLMAAQVEMVRDMQRLGLRQLDAAARRGLPFGLDIARVDLPVPTLSLRLDETRMREFFHAMADANLSAWARMADVVQAMPVWAKWMSRAPGEFWTGVFDRFTTLDGVEPANDSQKDTAAAGGFTLTSPPAAADSRPVFLKAARGTPDDLTRIKGIGAKLNAVLNDLGVFHFEQIASWTPENCAWIDEHLAFKGRVQREGWVEQARRLARDAA